MAKLPRPETLPTDSVAEHTCPCRWAGVPMHNRLLGLEDAGMDVLVGLFDSWADGGLAAECVPLAELGDFVAQHDWHNPEEMGEFASNFADIIRFAPRAA